MKIAILLGSVRTARQSHKIAFYIQEKLKLEGLTPIMIDLADHVLPMMEDRVGKSDSSTEEVSFIGEQLKQSDAILLVSPEYHGSFSGVLKNALDFFWIEFARKPIGVVTTGSGKMGGINASTQLQHVILSLGAYALPTKLLIPEIQHAFDDQMRPVREDIVKNTDRFLREFIWFSSAITKAKQEEKKNSLA